jgi:hypothetical protein
MSYCCRKLAMVLAALAALALAVPASAADVPASVPFRGYFTALVLGAPTPIPPERGEGAVVNWRATGQATYVGQITAVGTHDSHRGARDGDIDGTVTFTMGNGDQLSMKIVGGRPVSKLRDGTITITSGTGRFEGATGTAKFHSVDSAIVTKFTITFDGQITLVSPTFTPDPPINAAWAAQQAGLDLNPLPFGKTREQWAIEWWQWALSIPEADNPILDATGVKSQIGQSGPVFFLTGARRDLEIARRSITVPAGTALFFPVAAEVCVIGALGLTEADLHSCLLESPLSRGRVLGFAAIDGVPFNNKDLEKNLANYRYKTVPFTVSLPPDNLLSPLGGEALALSDGFWVMMAPLPVGRHTLQFKAFYITQEEFHDWTQDVTYHITVAPPTPEPSAGL